MFDSFWKLKYRSGKKTIAVLSDAYGYEVARIAYTEDSAKLYLMRVEPERAQTGAWFEINERVKFLLNRKNSTTYAVEITGTYGAITVWERHPKYPKDRPEFGIRVGMGQTEFNTRAYPGSVLNWDLIKETYKKTVDLLRI